MPSTFVRLLPILVVLGGLLVAAPAEAAAVSRLCGKAPFSTLHNGHYDSQKFRGHEDVLHGRGHVHDWWNKTHDYYYSQNNCPGGD